MAASPDTPRNAIGPALKDRGWSHSRLIVELRREARQEGVTLPDTPSLAATVSRWINNHQQPNEFYRVLLSRAVDRPRWELFGDEAALILPGSRGKPQGCQRSIRSV